MKIKSIFYTLIAAGIIAACSSDNKTVSESSTSDSVSNEISLNNDTVSAVYTHYIELKDALVKSDSIAARDAAAKLTGSLKDIHGCENTAAFSNKISQTNNIKEQRTAFTTLSSDIIGMIKTANLSAGKIFVQFCPMANEGSGGYWLASDKSIKNPYYGDEMLTCGEVKEEITPNQPKL